MKKEELEARLQLALDISRRASEYLLKHESLRSEITTKATNDFVTSADKACEKLIYESIQERYPEDGFFGEETGESGDKSRRWIIDPIDGTVDFMTDFPNYTVSIAFEDEEGLALGVIVIPRQKETFYAVRGGGAFLNGKPIHTDETSDFHKTLAILVPPHRHHEVMDTYMKRMVRFYDEFTDMRSIGSAACSLCYVASGRCTAYYEMTLHLYDMAAGVVIVREAGGIVTYEETEQGWLDIAASSSAIHDKVLELIR
ncbi:MAG: inositol monophosphatase [Spirochaetales bacterium]|nr:inositol monophosphatase [Candidatus Physcosoma equi]